MLPSQRPKSAAHFPMANAISGVPYAALSGLAGHLSRSIPSKMEREWMWITQFAPGQER
jgi:hypothetical protein